MKKIKFACNVSLLTLLAVGQWACAWDPYEHDADPVPETLTLTASSADIVLDEEHLTDPVLTFEWTPARQMSDDFLVTYTTKLDVVTNNFGSSTTIETVEDEGIFSRSFTSEQLNNWANERWNLPVNKNFTLAFRVIAEYVGGETYEMPEVRTVEVNVTPIHVDIFAADKMSIDGSSVVGGETEIEKTVENENLYAWYGDLQIGELQVPVEFDGLNYYLVPADGASDIHDGELIDVKMQETPVSWNIPAAGKYRLVIDMQNKQVRFYSEATDLKPLSVTFHLTGDASNPEVTIPVTGVLYLYGAGTGWGTKEVTFEPSMADPQILVYDAAKHNGTKYKGKMKFALAKGFTDSEGKPLMQSNGKPFDLSHSYCFTCPPKTDTEKQEISLPLGKVSELHGGVSSAVRNSYYDVPSADLLILDLRNMTILARNK